MENYQYSASSRGFYLQSIHGDNIPHDAVEVTPEDHAQLMQAQAEGAYITPGPDGAPVAIDPPAPTSAQVKEKKVATVQAHLDATARSLNYDSISNAITYADEPAVPKFQEEGRALRAWRSAVWARCYEILGEVEAGEIGMPSDDALIAALPEFQTSD